MIVIVPLAALLLDKGIQVREIFYPGNIAEYARLYAEGGNTALPPILVIKSARGQHWVVDGFHRVHAARQAKLLDVPAEVKTGTYRDAVLLACSQNKHGHPLTATEK